MQKAKYVILLALFFKFLEGNSFYDTMPPEDRKVHEIIEKTSEILHKRHGLILCGTGADGKFDFLEIFFEIHKKKDIYPSQIKNWV